MIIYITPSAASKLWAFVKEASGEISGFGNIEIIDSELCITDIWILKQVSNSSHTDIDSDALSEYMIKAIENNTFHMMKLWWHSHAGMGVFWSSEDKDTISKFSSDWMVSLVVNKKRESKAQLNTSIPVPLVVEDMKLQLMETKLAPEIYETIKSQVKELVSDSKVIQNTSVVPQQYYGHNNYCSYGGYGGMYGPDFSDDPNIIDVTPESTKEDKGKLRSHDVAPFGKKKKSRWFRSEKNQYAKQEQSYKEWEETVGICRDSNGDIITYNYRAMTHSACWILDQTTGVWKFRQMTPDERKAIVKDITEMAEYEEMQNRMGF